MSLSAEQRDAIVSWATRVAAKHGKHAVSSRLYDRTTLVAELDGVPPAELAQLVADACALANGKSFKGRVCALTVDLNELATLNLEIERAPLQLTSESSSRGSTGTPEAESVRELPKALAEALRASTQHTHAMAGTLIALVKEYGSGMAAMAASNERVIAALVTRAERAEQKAEQLDVIVKNALEVADESSKRAEQVTRDAKDLTLVLRSVAGPKIQELVGKVASQINGAVAPVAIPAGTPAETEGKGP